MYQEKLRMRAGNPVKYIMISLLCLITVAAMISFLLQDDSVHTVIYQLPDGQEADSSRITYHNGTMYVVTRETLYTLDESDGSLKLLTSLPSYHSIGFDYEEQMIYYTFGNSLYQCTFHGAELQKIYQEEQADSLRCIGLEDNCLYLMSLTEDTKGILCPSDLLMYQTNLNSVSTVNIDVQSISQILCGDDTGFVYVSKEEDYGAVYVYDAANDCSSRIVKGTETMNLTTVPCGQIVQGILYYLDSTGNFYSVSMSREELPKVIPVSTQEEQITTFYMIDDGCYLLAHSKQASKASVYFYSFADQKCHRFSFQFPVADKGEQLSDSEQQDAFFRVDDKIYYKDGQSKILYYAKLPLAYQ